MFDRRNPFGLAILSALLLSLMCVTPLKAAPAGGYSHVAVDTSALEAQGLGYAARYLGQALRDQLQRQFAGQLGHRGGPAIVVRLSGLSLPAYVGPGGDYGGRFGGGGGNSDFLEGDTLIVGRNGSLLGSHHILANIPSSSAGAWYDPEIDKKRLVAISSAYAGWSRRYVLGR